MKQLNFTFDEYLKRLTSVKNKMDKLGIDTLIVVDPANINYLSGYDGLSFYAHQGLVINIDEKLPYWYSREQDVYATLKQTYLESDNIIVYPEDFVQAFDKHTMSFVAQFIKQKSWDKGSIGLESDNYYFSSKSFEILKQELPKAKFVDADRLVNWVRIVKSDTEIEYMKQAGSISKAVMQKAYSTIEVGSFEHIAASEIAKSQIEGSKDYSGDSPAIFPIMPAANNTKGGHLTYERNRKYQNGDLVILELSGSRFRYSVPLYRTLYLGTPSEKLKNLSSTVVKIFEEMVETITPNSVGHEIEHYWHEKINKYYKCSSNRVGYSIGIGYPPDWGEHTINLRKNEKTIIQKGMTIHLFVSVRDENDVFEVSEPILVTENGNFPLVQFDKGLHHFN